MAAKWVRGRSIQQTFFLSSQNIAHTGDIYMMGDGHVERASSSMGLIDQAFVGLYEGPELSTSRSSAASYKIQLRVPTSPFVLEIDTSGTVATSQVGVQYGIATSEVSSGTSAYIGIANVDYGNFVYIGGGNSSGKNLFLGYPGGTLATST